MRKKIDSKLFEKYQLSDLSSLNKLVGGTCDTPNCNDEFTLMDHGSDWTECGCDDTSLVSSSNNVFGS